MAGSVPTLYWFDRWDERIGSFAWSASWSTPRSFWSLAMASAGQNARAFSLQTCQWHVFSEKARALSKRSHRALPPNLTTAASVTVVENTVTTAIDDLDELGNLDF